jgi:NAD(P)-dependent dehydrogenase (short-subunit alcohol dehydrogenase family)
MHKNYFDLEGRVALVTGGAGLLASEFAIALMDYGAKVILSDIDLDGCERKVKELAKRGYTEVTAYQHDVTSRDAWEKLSTEIEEKLGAIDILINAAAFTNQSQTSSFDKEFENVPLEDWQRVLDVNLTGSFLGCQIVGKRMVRHGKGTIINIASLYGVVSPNHKMYPGTGIVQPVAYTVSKHGIIGLTKYAATWLAEKGVRVNAITPGGVFNDHDDLFLERFGQLCPNGRMMHKEELRGAIVYLASDASSNVIGHNLIVDGGWTVW